MAPPRPDDVTAPVASKTVSESKSASSGSIKGPKSKEQKRLEAEARNRLSGERKRLKKLVDDPDSGDWKGLPASLLPEAQRLLEARIEQLESEKSKLEHQLADPEFYADTARSSKVIRMFEETNVRIKAIMNRWEVVANQLQD